MRIVAGKFLNVCLRGSALATRTLFLFGLAYAFPPSDVGLFGLMVALIGTLTSLVSFDFYTVVIREPPGSPAASVAANSYVAVVLITCVLGAVLMLGNLIASPVPKVHWPVITLLFVVEHWCHESYRTLEGRNHILAASLSLFFRSAAWPILCVLAYLLVPSAATLSVYSVFYVWFAFSAAAALVFIPRALSLIGYPRLRTNFRTVGAHALAAGRMFIATILHRLLFYADRLLIGAAFGATFLGFYTFYFTFFGGILALLDAAIFSFIYPQLIALANGGDLDAFRQVVVRMRRELRVATALTALICLIILTTTAVLPRFSGYYEQGWMAGLVFVSCVLVMLSYQYHYVLFALRCDSALVITNALGMTALLAAILVGYMVGRAEIAACGIPLAGATMLLAKRSAAQSAMRTAAVSQ